MSTYMDPSHPDAFVDHPMQQMIEGIGHTHVCPKCKGHGGWNLQLNVYPLHGYEDTPENRHRFAHFRAGCTQCHGFGYVPESESVHVHEWVSGDGGRVVRCDCGAERHYDTSD